MTNPQALVLVDKIPSTLEAVASSLKGRGFDVEVTSDCETALRLVGMRRLSVVLVGNLGDQMSRWEFCKYLRGIAPPGDTVIIVALPASSRLTAIRCLEEGADACMTLPLTADDLLTRIGILRRTSPAPEPEIVRYRGLEVNYTAQRASYEGRVLKLNVAAIALLGCLVRSPEREIPRAELGTQLGLSNPARLRRIDSQIHRIRLALLDARCPHIIRTIRLHGYSLSTRVGVGALLGAAVLKMGGSLSGLVAPIV